jgi:hypothetical protein
LFVCFHLFVHLFFPVGFFGFYLFVCFVIVGSLFLFLFLLSFFFIFLYYQLYHHHLLILTLIPFTLPPSPVLKSIDSLPNSSFCPFSPTLFPQHSPIPHILPQPVTRPHLPPIHSSPADNVLYQLYTTPNPCNP